MPKNEVDAWVEKDDNPMKAVVQEVRRVIKVKSRR
jgi:hypothetical protein